MRAYHVRIYLASRDIEDSCFFGYPPLAHDVIRYLTEHSLLGEIYIECVRFIEHHGLLSCDRLSLACPSEVETFEDGFMEITLIHVDRKEPTDRRDNRIRQLIEQRRVLIREFRQLIRKGETLGEKINVELGLISPPIPERLGETVSCPDFAPPITADV